MCGGVLSDQQAVVCLSRHPDAALPELWRRTGFAAAAAKAAHSHDARIDRPQCVVSAGLALLAAGEARVATHTVVSHTALQLCAPVKALGPLHWLVVLILVTVMGAMPCLPPSSICVEGPACLHGPIHAHLLVLMITGQREAARASRRAVRDDDAGLSSLSDSGSASSASGGSGGGDYGGVASRHAAGSAGSSEGPAEEDPSYGEAPGSGGSCGSPQELSLPDIQVQALCSHRWHHRQLSSCQPFTGSRIGSRPDVDVLL
jgi:hypothetical protein